MKENTPESGGICRPGQQVAVSFKAQRGPKSMGGNERKVFLIITTAQSEMHSMNIISVSVLGTFFRKKREHHGDSSI